MTTIQTNIRWASNTEELTRNLKQGIDTLDVMRKAVDRTAQSLGGEGLLTAANRITVAIKEMGGVQRLTTAEQERNLATLDKAIQKYEALGRVAPTAVKQTADALRQAIAVTQSSTNATEQHVVAHSKLGEVLKLNIPLTRELSARFTENIGVLGAWGGAIAAVAIGFEAVKKGIEFGEKVAENAKTLRALSNETGIGVEKIQQLAAATTDFNITQEQLARGIYQLSRRVAGDDQSAAAAFRLMGISMRDLKDEAPDEIFEKTLRAVNAIPDPLTRSAVAADLFGARFAQALLAIGPEFDELLEKVKQSGEFMSQDAVQGAARFSDAMDHLGLRIKAVAGEIIAPLLEQMAEFIEKSKQMPSIGPAPSGPLPFAASGKLTIAEAQQQLKEKGPATGHLAEMQKQFADATAMSNILGTLRKEFVALTPEQNKYLQSLAALGKEFLNEKNIIGTGITSQQLSAFKEAFGQNEQAAKALQKAIDLVAQAQVSYGDTLKSIAPAAAAEIQDLMRRGLWLDAMAPKYGVNEAQVKALAMQIQVETEIMKLATGATIGLTSSTEKLGQVDIETIGTIKAKTKAEDERLAVLAKLAELQTQMAGKVDTHLLPGDAANELGEVNAGLAETERLAKQTHTVFQLLDTDLGLLGNTGSDTFNKVVRIVQAVIRALEQMLAATLAETTALAALNFLKGVQIGLSFLAFVNTGGVITPQGKVQHFDRGGMVSPFGGPPNSKDTVPIWAMPNEMFINPVQQARLFHIIDGQIPAMGAAGGNVVENHYHSHAWDLRQAVITNEQGLDRLSREVAKRNATGVARNYDSTNTRGRAGYGLRS